MKDEKPALGRGTEYVVIFSGGPFDGQTDRRISTDGSWDDQLTVLAESQGHETMINYHASSWRELDGLVHVTYTFDSGESEAMEDPVDRLD